MRRPWPVLLVFAGVLAGCSDHGDPVEPGGGEEGPGPVSYAARVQPLWNSHCIGCHGAGGNGGLDLRGPDSRDRLVGVDAQGHPGVRVVAGEPDQSVLYLKMTGAGGVGTVMPPTGVLGGSDLETVRRWIEEGALDN
jgi:hypothetical protein